jgi:hypothetical protein
MMQINHDLIDSVAGKILRRHSRREVFQE